MVNTAQQPKRGRRFQVLLVVGLIAVLVVFSLILSVAPSAQNGSTYSRSLTGYRGWYDYMQQQQRPVKRWRRSYDQLSGSGQTLIRIGGSPLGHLNFNASEGFDIDGWADIQPWLTNGNTVIQLTWQGEVTAAPFKSRLAAGKNQVQIETTRRYALAGGTSGGTQETSELPPTPELQDQFGVVVWSQKLGKGTLISGTYPWLAANALVEPQDNYRFLADLAQRQSGPIWIDEWIHGYRDPSEAAKEEESKSQDFMAYLARTPVAVIAAQVFFLLLLLVWGHNHRFGALISPTVPSQNTSEQYIQALASTMNAARKTDFATHMLGDFVRQTLAERLGLRTVYGSQRPEAQQLAIRGAAVTGRSVPELLELLEPTVRSDRELLAWVANVESLLRELP